MDTLRSPSTLRAALLIAVKDVRVIFRDRQTVIYAILLPLLMYPVLFWVLIQAMLLIQGKREDATVRVAVIAEAGAEERAEELEELLGLRGPDATVADATGSDGLAASPEPSVADGANGEGHRSLEDAGFGLVAADPPSDGGGLAAETDEQIAQLLGIERDEHRADVALVLPDSVGPLEVHFDGARSSSSNGRDRIEGVLDELAERERTRRLAEIGRDDSALEALELTTVNLSSTKEKGAFIASMLLPMMIILMAVMGAFYPAIDLTAGERERKTEETTLLAPVSRVAVALGKILAVSVAGLLASIVNLAGMALAAGYLLGLLGGPNIGFELDPRSLLLIAPFALPLTLFISALLTAVASLAETFKQGQSLMGSAQMLFIFPAMAATLPGISLSPGIAATPIVGAAIAFRTVLRGGALEELPWGGLAITFVALLLYALGSLAFAVRVLNAELQTGGEETGALQRLRRALVGKS